MIKIITVGKINQKGIEENIKYYLKQCPVKIEIIEVLDEPSKQGKIVEGERILSKIKDGDDVILLAILGHMYTSEEFAKMLDTKMTYQTKDIVFIIGGSYGVSDDVYKRANSQISFSKMTFPHQLMRLILVEQIYRGFMILHNHPYHK